MSRGRKSSRASRGRIETLPSGSLRVRLSAGFDPLTGRRNRLEETVPAGPDAQAEAEKVLNRFIAQLDDQRNARTKATVNQMLDRYLANLTVSEKTAIDYESLARNHIRPLVGDVQVARIDAELLDSFYAELRRCRVHCRDRRFIQHRTGRPHECDDRCKPHKCKGLGDGSLRKIDSVLMGAGKNAVRWRWIGVNPFELTEQLPAAKPEPDPPTADQAATIANEAFRDIDWGMLVWLAMVTGARRGELCALKWEDVTLKPGAGVLHIKTSIAQRGRRTWEKETKTHQQRRITVDDATVDMLAAYQRFCAQRANLGAEMPTSARVLSDSVDGSTWRKPDSVSQRYERMCARLGWDMNIHQLRHYSATELILAGVDVATVGGRLGHGGGGSTTLKFYTAWVSEADQRAAGTLSARMPLAPIALDPSGAIKSQVKPTEDARYQRIAADLRGAIMCGALRPGQELPPFAELAARYGVATNTAQRAVRALRVEGLVSVRRGRRAIVVDPSGSVDQSNVVDMPRRKQA